MIRFGTAGWEYRDWSGIVYPRPEPRGFDRLRHLAGLFGTVEVNSTFYRPWGADAAARWCERVADVRDFRFAAKVWRRLTHERDAYSAAEVAQARAALDRLAAEGRLGAALLQFPWSFKREEANEEWLRGLFRAFAGLPLVVEVRHASWDVDEVVAELAERGVGMVNVDQPIFRHSLRPDAKVTSSVAYVRVHGRNAHDWFRKGAGRDARYDYLYSAEELEPWAARVATLARTSPPRPRRARAPASRTDTAGEGGAPPAPDAPAEVTAGVPDVYVVTNNHFRGQAAANAKMLEAMVRRTKVAAPPELFRAYEDALRPWAFPAGSEPRAPAQPELFPP